MKKYLIFSQLLYWDLQVYVDNFHKIIKTVCKRRGNVVFPFQKLRNFVKGNRRRGFDLTADDDFDYSPQHWFALKVLTPDNEFSFLADPDERYNPEIDHIFPETPQSKKKYPKKYCDWVAIVWNLQPVKGEINNLKRNTPPKEFFSEYPQYLKDYDFLPTKDLNDKRWQVKYAKEFIQFRKEKMVQFIERNYGINIKSQ